LSNNFVYATRTQYEKVQKRICFWDTKPNFWTKFYYFNNCLRKMANYRLFGAFYVKKLSPNFEKNAKDRYDSVGRCCLLDVLYFSKEKQLII
jgi:hypothetical protein